MVLFLGYIEERWGYFVIINQEKKKEQKKIREIQDKRNHEIIQGPITLLHDTFWQFCPLRPACS